MTILNLPKHRNPGNNDRRSSAPYNFVPLPEKVVSAVNNPNELPGHDAYADPKYPKYPHTGYFDVTLTTKSPLYVRGMLTRAEFDLDEQGKDHHGRPVQNGVTRIEDRLKNKPDFFHTGDAAKPVIPGSSLRGMLRSLVEIISYSKFGPMSKSPKISFRAVAAPGDDPLSMPYDEILGRNGKNVAAGYLVKQSGKWKIQPAKKPGDLGLLERGAYLKVKDSRQLAYAVKGLKRFNDPDYLPQFYSVSFETETRTDRQGRRYTAVAKISSDLAAYKLKGALVCSGNMLETSGEGQESPRKNYSLVTEPDRKASLIEIRDEAIADYIDSLTPFLKDPPFDPVNGCLIQYQPVFYVEQDGMAICFGHCPNFRVSAFLKGTGRAATPADFLPLSLNQSMAVDFADALFGYVGKKRRDAEQGSKSNAYAGRVSVTDAATDETDVFLPNSPFTPEILATPKPTAFQHYLTQKSDAKRQLKHYGSSPNETTIRGFKRYWPQGDKSVDDLRAEAGSPSGDQQGNVEPTSTQHTHIKPVRSGVKFRFRIYFENLSDAELGALCWALHPLGAEGKTYCHQIGMGKPLGMGAVTLDTTLHLNRRKERYGSLFAGESWVMGYEAKPPLRLTDRGEKVKSFTDAFEQEVLKQLGNPCERLFQLKRIAMLLRMLDWQDLLPSEELRTQDLQTGFKERKVLPDPSKWIDEEDRKRLVTPLGTEEPTVNDDIRPGDAPEASSSGMGNALTLQISPPQPPPAALQPSRESVILAGNINFTKRRAQVKIDGIEIPCEGMPSTAYGAPKKGDEIQVMVTRDSTGKPISSRYISS